ncbi:MAG TPA: adenylosuccinate synthase [Candidatus Thermoplasmatota archaeon]|nr:adenylosuccinate synthase [Candidatus Thermoplasmatota archaeon]
MPVTAIVGAQWGDEGKGKVVDALAEHAKYVVRFQGGNNAGHTIVVGDETYKLHHIPSGVVSGKAGVIGNGCVVDPTILVEEITALQARGLRFDLYISDRAHLVLPYHKQQDKVEEELRGAKKVGTTGRGIGPCYGDKAARMGVQAGDLLHPERLEAKVKHNAALKQALLKAYGSSERVDAKATLMELQKATDVLRPFITDTVKLVQDAAREDENVLLEGAQGVMLDLDHGTYPYVTSSSTASGGMASGSGLSPRDIGDVVGVVKAYTTRVGSGPFPTELSLESGVGKHLSEVGKEVGTTTGRKRRCGWLDLVVVNHAVRLCGITQLAVTKLDVLSGIGPVQVCTAYQLPDGKKVTHVPSDPDLFAKSKPVYQSFEGWDQLGDGSWESLPTEARTLLQFLREKTGAHIRMVGTGPARDQLVLN